MFSADGKAVYVNAGYYPALRLVKIDIRSLERSTVATSKYAVDIRIAPDDSTIAFTEFEQAYLTPFSGTAQAHARAHTHQHVHVHAHAHNSIDLVLCRRLQRSEAAGVELAHGTAAEAAAAVLAGRYTLRNVGAQGRQVDPRLAPGARPLPRQPA